jgi:acetoin utilization deacetylase AcuC-like enzyme
MDPNSFHLDDDLPGEDFELEQQNRKRTGVCVDKSYYRHIANGPEIPERIDAILKGVLAEKDLNQAFNIIQAREATKEEVLLVHSEEVSCFLRLIFYFKKFM